LDTKVIANELKNNALYRESFGIPEVYMVGTSIEIDTLTYDKDYLPVDVQEVKVYIQSPLGEVLTISGEDILTASGYEYCIYRPEIKGWHIYWVSVVDSLGLTSISNPIGFEVIDYN